MCRRSSSCRKGKPSSTSGSVAAGGAGMCSTVRLLSCVAVWLGCVVAEAVWLGCVMAEAAWLGCVVAEAAWLGCVVAEAAWLGCVVACLL